jgi:DNA-directed RNA polymerase subunit RPC12/RpoP
MPRLLKRQEAPVEGRIVGRVPVCIACGNRRTFWVKRGEQNAIANAWEIASEDTIIACGRCRSRNSVLFDVSES